MTKSQNMTFSIGWKKYVGVDECSFLLDPVGIMPARSPFHNFFIDINLLVVHSEIEHDFFRLV
jgi:hypothetical protein